MDFSAIKYKDEKDRALGLSGMAIALYACDGEHFLASVSVDSPAGEGLELTPDFALAANQNNSAKAVWNQLLRQYELSSAMLLGNVMCRSYVGMRRPVDHGADRLLRTLVNDHGKESCQLDADETRHIYEKTFAFLDRIFVHSLVAETARQLSDKLCAQRQLSGTEIFDILSPLGR